MPKRRVSDDALFEALKRHHWNRTDTALELGITPRNVIERAGQLRRKGYKVGSPASCHQTNATNADPIITIRSLKDQVRQLSRQVLTDQLVRRELLKVADGSASPPPTGSLTRRRR